MQFKSVESSSINKCFSIMKTCSKTAHGEECFNTIEQVAFVYDTDK